jgi:hypothetical protein
VVVPGGEARRRIRWRVLIWLPKRDFRMSEEEVIEMRQGGGLASLVGLSLVAPGLIVLVVLATGGITPVGHLPSLLVYAFLWLFDLLLLASGVWLLVGRTGVTISGRRREVTTWWGILAPLRRRTNPLDAFRGITITLERRSGVFGPPHTTFPVRLVGDSGQVMVDGHPETPAGARRLAERIARTTGLPIQDATLQTPG